MHIGMARINLDPLTTFPDGTQLVISTQSSKEGGFICELYVARHGLEGHMDLRVVSNHLEGSTCLKAQSVAFSYAQRLYPDLPLGMKEPPYLIWHGPSPTS
jgi:hypothetical protein